MYLAVAMLFASATGRAQSQEPFFTGTVHTGQSVSVTAPVGPPALRLLTASQYKATVADIFGSDINADGDLPPEIRKDGLLALGSAQTTIAPTGIEEYALLAHKVAAQVIDEKHRNNLIGCAPSVPLKITDSCTKGFIATAGRLLYRRPLTSGELKTQLELAQKGAGILKDRYAGIGASLTNMLSSPQFLYRWENPRVIRSTSNEGELDSYSAAQRLSFFLWNSAPDAELLSAAQSGKLDTSSGWNRQVDRLLASPRLELGLRAYFEDMLGFDGFKSLSKDLVLYPKYSSILGVDAKEETLRTIIDLLLRNGGDYRDLFIVKDTFLTKRLGAVYGVPTEAASDTWAPFKFSDRDPRGAGILTHASFVALHSHPGRSSATIRGRAIRELLLCQKVPDPPGNVNFNLVQDTSNPLYRTARQRLQVHATEPMCAGCHKLTDPVGLSLENFDTIGAHRTEENGAVIDASGQLDGVKFEGANGLGKAMHDSPAATACVAEKLYEYGVGHSVNKAEREWLKTNLGPSFEQEGYRIVPLLRLIAMSPGFRAVVNPVIR